MNAFSAYKEHNVTSQSPGQLIIMLYDGAIKFLHQAIGKIEAGDAGEKAKLIEKAINIIEELNVSLDLDQGGEVANNLRSLYNFMVRQLTTANLKQDTQMIREVITLLSELNESWKAISA